MPKAKKAAPAAEEKKPVAKEAAKPAKKEEKKDCVKVFYKGEQSVSNRTFLVKGKPFRMEKGVHELPKACYEAFASSPVGKELVKRECLKVVK